MLVVMIILVIIMLIIDLRLKLAISISKPFFVGVEFGQLPKAESPRQNKSIRKREVKIFIHNIMIYLCDHGDRNTQSV